MSDGIRRYVHLGTGNYNPSTARLYTDLSLLTCRPEFGEDATNLFNLLTGICQFPGHEQTPRRAVRPARRRCCNSSQREAANAKRGLPARIIAKMNSLVDPEIIEALYAASQAGVKIDLIVRGICCLRPGVKGLSENITVRSIVDRFLEHSRIFYFENACQPEVFVGSADWMPRNFFRRIEVVFPIEDGILRDRIIREILGMILADNSRARFLGADGIYRRAKIADGEKPRRSQSDFMALATPKTAEKAKEKIPRVELVASPFPKEENLNPMWVEFMNRIGRQLLPAELLLLGSRRVPVLAVRHPRARRYLLRLRLDGTVRVTIPRRGNQLEARRFVERNRGWLEEQFQRLQNHPRPVTTWQPGSKIWLRGELVQIQSAENGKIHFGGEILAVKDPGADLRPVIEKHLRRLAEGELRPRVLEFAARHNFTVQRVTVRNQKSRWGSCSRRGAISLNWRLLQTPDFVRDYIILHELAHLRHMNHSDRFWQEVENLCPNHLAAERWLKAQSGFLG